MDAATIVEQLRAAGFYPALKDGGMRLYGTMEHLPPPLREAIHAERDAIVAYLRRPEQSIAYDLLDIARQASWHPRLHDGDVKWWRGQESSTDPMPTAATRTALDQHRDEVVAVLRQVPPGCRDRDVCEQAGICQDELAHSACTGAQTALAASPPREDGETDDEGPRDADLLEIWTCGGCHLPRSSDARPCPSCGAIDGYVALRPATGFGGLHEPSPVRLPDGTLTSSQELPGAGPRRRVPDGDGGGTP